MSERLWPLFWRKGMSHCSRRYARWLGVFCLMRSQQHVEYHIPHARLEYVGHDGTRFHIWSKIIVWTKITASVRDYKTSAITWKLKLTSHPFLEIVILNLWIISPIYHGFSKKLFRSLNLSSISWILTHYLSPSFPEFGSNWSIIFWRSDTHWQTGI